MEEPTEELILSVSDIETLLSADAKIVNPAVQKELLALYRRFRQCAYAPGPIILQLNALARKYKLDGKLAGIPAYPKKRGKDVKTARTDAADYDLDLVEESIKRERLHPMAVEGLLGALKQVRANNPVANQSAHEQIADYIRQRRIPARPQKPARDPRFPAARDNSCVKRQRPRPGH
jgi:hypothetical protein